MMISRFATFAICASLAFVVASAAQAQTTNNGNGELKGWVGKSQKKDPQEFKGRDNVNSAATGGTGGGDDSTQRPNGWNTAFEAGVPPGWGNRRFPHSP